MVKTLLTKNIYGVTCEKPKTLPLICKLVSLKCKTVIMIFVLIILIIFCKITYDNGNELKNKYNEYNIDGLCVLTDVDTVCNNIFECQTECHWKIYNNSITSCKGIHIELVTTNFYECKLNYSINTVTQCYSNILCDKIYINDDNIINYHKQSIIYYVISLSLIIWLIILICFIIIYVKYQSKYIKKLYDIYVMKLYNNKSYLLNNKQKFDYILSYMIRNNSNITICDEYSVYLIYKYIYINNKSNKLLKINKNSIKNKIYKHIKYNTSSNIIINNISDNDSSSDSNVTDTETPKPNILHNNEWIYYNDNINDSRSNILNSNKNINSITNTTFNGENESEYIRSCIACDGSQTYNDDTIYNCVDNIHIV